MLSVEVTARSLLQSVVTLENEMLRVKMITAHLCIIHSRLPQSLPLHPICSDGAFKAQRRSSQPTHDAGAQRRHSQRY